jgi:hypothetical protein
LTPLNRVLDARDPAAIVAVVTLPGSYGDVVVAGRTLYAVGSRNYEAGVVLFDVTTPAAPVEIGFAPVPGVKDLAVWMQTNRTKLTAVDTSTAVDVSNPSAPVDVGYYLTQDAGREVAVTSGHAFAFARGTDAPYVFELVALRAPAARAGLPGVLGGLLK